MSPSEECPVSAPFPLLFCSIAKYSLGLWDQSNANWVACDNRNLFSPGSGGQIKTGVDWYLISEAPLACLPGLTVNHWCSSACVCIASSLPPAFHGISACMFVFTLVLFYNKDIGQGSTFLHDDLILSALVTSATSLFPRSQCGRLGLPGRKFLGRRSQW